MTKQWTGIGAATLAILFLSLLVAVWNSCEDQRAIDERKRREEPSLVPNGPPYSPDPKSSATCFVPLQSEYSESRQALVKHIVFTVTDNKPTKGPVCCAPAETIPVPFSRIHWDGRAKFDFYFDPPQTVKGGETVIFALSLTDPKWVGKTYLGKVEIYYDNKKLAYPDLVRIDVSATPPKNFPSRLVR